MREALRAFWASRSRRERLLLVVAGCFVSASVLDLLIVRPFRGYRQEVTAELAVQRERLVNDQRYLARAADIEADLVAWKERLEQLRTRLVPGETATLGAANLQDTLHALAAETGVTVQSTQVIREEPAKGAQPVSVRLSLSGELGGIVDFLTRVEHGALQVRVPFLEIGRRGAFRATRRQSAAVRGRTLSVTIQVTGFLRGADDTDAAQEDEGA